MGSWHPPGRGDSRRPLLFSGAPPYCTALDLLFVLRFGMGVEGVAWAWLSWLHRPSFGAIGDRCPSANGADSAADPLVTFASIFPLLRQIIRVGVLCSLQMAITAFLQRLCSSPISTPFWR